MCLFRNESGYKENQPEKLRNKKKHTFKKFWTFSKDCFSCFLRSFFLCDERSLLDGDSYKAQECPRSFLLWRKFLSQIFGILYLGDKSLCLFYYVWSSLVWNSIHIYFVFDHVDQYFICPKPNMYQIFYFWQLPPKRNYQAPNHVPHLASLKGNFWQSEIFENEIFLVPHKKKPVCGPWKLLNSLTHILHFEILWFVPPTFYKNSLHWVHCCRT